MYAIKGTKWRFDDNNSPYPIKKGEKVVAFKYLFEWFVDKDELIEDCSNNIIFNTINNYGSFRLYKDALRLTDEIFKPCIKVPDIERLLKIIHRDKIKYDYWANMLEYSKSILDKEKLKRILETLPFKKLGETAYPKELEKFNNGTFYYVRHGIDGVTEKGVTLRKQFVSKSLLSINYIENNWQQLLQ